MSDIQEPVGTLPRWLHRRAQARNLAYHPGFRLPFGLRALGGTNYGAIIVLSRHPKWSITWLWVLDWKSASGRNEADPRWLIRWRRRFLCNWRVAALGPLGTFSFRAQRAVPLGVGRRNHNPKQFRSYVRRIADERAAAAAGSARREVISSMYDGRGDD